MDEKKTKLTLLLNQALCNNFHFCFHISLWYVFKLDRTHYLVEIWSAESDQGMDP